ASVKFQYQASTATAWTDLNTDSTPLDGYTLSRSEERRAGKEYNARAIATDLAGNSTTSTSQGFTVDTVAPTVSLSGVSSYYKAGQLVGIGVPASDTIDGTGVASVKFQYQASTATAWTDLNTDSTPLDGYTLS